MEKAGENKDPARGLLGTAGSVLDPAGVLKGPAEGVSRVRLKAYLSLKGKSPALLRMRIIFTG